MRSITTRIALVGVVIVICISSLRAQSQTPQKNVKSGASVSGRVTIKGKGVPFIAVALRKPEMSNPFETFPRAVTDQEGNYKITNIVAGAYDVAAYAPAYVSASSEGLGKRVVIGENENIENVNFSLVKGGAITGKIVDADTRPVIQTQVRVYRLQELPNRPISAPPNAARPAPTPILYPAASQLTDDRGIYRFFGLTPGRYTVAVGHDNEGFGMPSRTMYKEVFYPDTPDRAQAQMLEVSEGSEAKDIDIALGRPIETYSASGRVINGENGEGLPNMRFTLQQIVNDRTSFMNSFVTTNSRGDFLAENLIPGKYLAFMAQQPNAELRAENTTFEIIDSDVTGVTIRMVKGGSISGVVVLDTEDKSAFERLTKLQLQGYVQNPAGGSTPGGSVSRATIGPDGSFRLNGLGPGIVLIQLVPTMDINQMKGFSVAYVARDGVPLAPRSFELKDGEQVSNIKVSVAYGNATLRGVVNIENGPLSQGQRIMVRLMKVGDQQPPNIRPPTVDDRGRFIAEGIPSGSWELWVTVVGVRKPPLKQTVELQNGIVTDVTINFDVAEKTSP